jgi:hypothetical protein
MAKVKVNIKRHVEINGKQYDAGEYFVSEETADKMRGDDVKREGRITFPDEVIEEREKAKESKGKKAEVPVAPGAPSTTFVPEDK